ncbi:ABC transporter permease subunit [Spiribacter halobius]|uniref:Branched-chain amino acid ABC transporter permease n=1 Tax=Sediminicurvatus halobius TaxID=2182432 RepID=A0A2U2N9Z4_9GAMM|nr:branched-chain amino acid ABC transporter permease [Spiribacter halobius]PWG65789.1 branched-chain amino acid ABC transporter permease [Spiribacter halobius]UEX77830.1 urea ABC transporter permease subunit UrtB [Spiribacter halobius]
MDQLASTGITALFSISVLLIATMGLAVIFGMMGVINLAHGEFLMLGAYATLFATKAGVPFALAVVLAALALGLFGALIERAIIQFLYGRLFDTLLATWGLGMVLYQGAILTFGASTTGIGLPMGSFSIGRYSMPVYYLFLIAMAALMAVAVYLVFVRTRYGIMARAAIQNPAMAGSVGIETRRINTVTFAFGAALAGLAGGLLVPAFPATPDMGLAFVSKAFLAVVVAGPLTLTGTVASMTGLGGLSSLTSSILTSVAGDVAFFVVTIIILRFFPGGISRGWRGKL